MASRVPDNPSLDRLRNDARSLPREVIAARRGALGCVRRYHPHPDTALADAPGRFALHNAQLTVARRYGFTGGPHSCAI